MNIKPCCGCPDGKEYIHCGCDCHKKMYNIGYELVNAEDCFDDDNDGLIYGIHWLDEYGNVLDCEWFKTEEERQECIDKWYAEEQDIFTPEQ